MKASEYLTSQLQGQKFTSRIRKSVLLGLNKAKKEVMRSLPELLSSSSRKPRVKDGSQSVTAQQVKKSPRFNKKLTTENMSSPTENKENLKRERFPPINKEELLEHEKLYKFFKQEQELRRALRREKTTLNMPTNEFLKLLMKDRENKMKTAKLHEERVRKLKKREEYAKIIKEKHWPTIDPLKQIAALRAKNNTIHSSLQFDKKHKDLGRNNFLEQIRLKRERAENSVINQLRKDAAFNDFHKELDLKSIRSEGILKRICCSNPLETRVEENVNDLIISSVKSKALLLLNTDK